MRILVDADACPGINLITNIAKENNLELILYFDDTHNIENKYAKIVILSKGYQSVDMYISNELKENDILITQDFGLATIALARKAHAIHPKGLIFNDENIDMLLYERHISGKLRKKGIHSNNPKKRTSMDDDKLITSLKRIIMEVENGI